MMGPAELTSLGPSGRIATPCARSPCPGGSAHSPRSEEHTSELQSQSNIVCRLLLEKKNRITYWSPARMIPLPTPVEPVQSILRLIVYVSTPAPPGLEPFSVSTLTPADVSPAPQVLL